MGNIINQCAADEAYAFCTRYSDKENINTTEDANGTADQHMLDDPIVGSLLSATHCTGNVCDPANLARITMAATSQNRFLVDHKVDRSERRLLSHLKVDEVMRKVTLNEALSNNMKNDVPMSMSISNSHSGVSSHLTAENGDVAATTKHSTAVVANMDQNQNITDACDGSTSLQTRNTTSLGGYRCKDVLMLRMRASFANFYRSTYLDAFPSHIEKGSAQARTIGTPEVAPDSLLNALSIDSETDIINNTMNAQRNVNVRLIRTKEMFLNLCLQGSLGLKDEEGTVIKSAVVSSSVSPAKQKQLVLLDKRTRSPVAVCTLKSKYGPPVITIHSPNPNVFCQAPSGVKFEGRALYPYAEFLVEGEWPLPVRYSMSFAVGNNRFEDQPSYRASHVKVGSPDISVVGKTGSESVMAGCCLINLSKSSDRFALSIAKGVDPALFICLAAIVDEVLEHTMRRQFANQLKDKQQSNQNRR